MNTTWAHKAARLNYKQRSSFTKQIRKKHSKNLEKLG